jgi:hypothetical protein
MKRHKFPFGPQSEILTEGRNEKMGNTGGDDDPSVVAWGYALLGNTSTSAQFGS